MDIRVKCIAHLQDRNNEGSCAFSIDSEAGVNKPQLLPLTCHCVQIKCCVLFVTLAKVV